MSLHLDGIPFRLCWHLAKNPGSVMFVADISEKWGVPRKLVWARTRPARLAGMVELHKAGRESYFTAGPKLLEML